MKNSGVENMRKFSKAIQNHLIRNDLSMYFTIKIIYNEYKFA